MLDWNDYLQAIIAVFVITDPVGRPLFFAMLTKDLSRAERRKGALQVIAAVAIILLVSAVAGKAILNAMGIHLGAFGLVGGLIVCLMGLEMMALGEPSRAQGGHRSVSEPKPEDQLLVPFAMPFIAGPGAITIVITLASQADSMASVWMALIAVGVSVATMCVTFLFLTDVLLKIPRQAMSLITKFGGLLIAAIGAQLALNGIKQFFEL